MTNMQWSNPYRMTRPPGGGQRHELIPPAAIRAVCFDLHHICADGLYWRRPGMIIAGSGEICLG
jgi:hypothetical protein